MIIIKHAVAKGIKRNIILYHCLFFTISWLFTFFIVIMIISDDLFISFSFLVKQANYMFVFTLMVPLLLMKFHKLTHGVVLCSPAAVLLFCQEQKHWINFPFNIFTMLLFSPLDTKRRQNWKMKDKNIKIIVYLHCKQSIRVLNYKTL